MSIALYNNIAIVVAYVFDEVARVVIKVFVTSVSGDVTVSAVKVEVVIDVIVADETYVVFNIVGLVILKSVVPMFNSFPVLPATVVKADGSAGVETVDALP